MDKYLEQYLITALWSSIDDNEEPFDLNYTVDDISEEFKEKSKNEWESFQKKAGSLLDGLDMTNVAHDFWLTRNGHGSGFWDGDYEKNIGESLTKISKEFPEVYLYLGDDKQIHGD